jgi:hypothetical protein
MNFAEFKNLFRRILKRFIKNDMLARSTCRFDWHFVCIKLKKENFLNIHLHK